MSVLKVIRFGGIRLAHKNWLSEVTIIREVQRRLASPSPPAPPVPSMKVLASLVLSGHGLEIARVCSYSLVEIEAGVGTFIRLFYMHGAEKYFPAQVRNISLWKNVYGRY